MDTAAWILVVILSITLFIFLVVGIILIVKIIDLIKETKGIITEGQDIAKNANSIVTNVKGMTSIGGTIEMFVDKYINPKLKAKLKEDNAKERTENGGKRAKE